MPVFSMEWLIMQNFENFNLSSFEDKFFKRRIKTFVNNLITEEIQIRTQTESYLKLNNLNYNIEENDKNDSEESFTCDMCTYHGFLSQLQCNNCKKKGCLPHGVQCKCLPTDFTLRYRYMINELLVIKAKKC